MTKENMKAIMNRPSNTNYALNSTEVAKMINKEHKDLLKDIRRYIYQINESNFALVGEEEILLTEFFIESTYVDSKGQIRPSYNITRKGCEFIANKLTGTKGTMFTAKFINRFHETTFLLKLYQILLRVPLMPRRMSRNHTAAISPPRTLVYPVIVNVLKPVKSISLTR